MFLDKKYAVIYADPPWRYRNNRCVQKKSVLNGDSDYHYDTMTLEDIQALPIQDIADKDCLLFLWATAPMLPEAMETLEAWGFKYCTIGFVWHKVNPTYGFYTMGECEFVLVGKVGKIPKKAVNNIRQFLQEKKNKHSAKPSEIRDRITKMFPDHNKIELFAREVTEGWDVWGNEV